MASPGEHDHASDTVAVSLEFFVDTGEKPVTYAPDARPRESIEARSFAFF